VHGDVWACTGKEQLVVHVPGGGGTFGLTVKSERLMGDKMAQVHNQGKQRGKIITFKRLSIF
jgi:hypothetical protein